MHVYSYLFTVTLTSLVALFLLMSLSEALARALCLCLCLCLCLYVCVCTNVGMCSYVGFQIGSIRPIRVDHTDFSKWILKLLHSLLYLSLAPTSLSHSLSLSLTSPLSLSLTHTQWNREKLSTADQALS